MKISDPRKNLVLKVNLMYPIVCMKMLAFYLLRRDMRIMINPWQWLSLTTKTTRMINKVKMMGMILEARMIVSKMIDPTMVTRSSSNIYKPTQKVTWRGEGWQMGTSDLELNVTMLHYLTKGHMKDKWPFFLKHMRERKEKQPRASKSVKWVVVVPMWEVNICANKF